MKRRGIIATITAAVVGIAAGAIALTVAPDAAPSAVECTHAEGSIVVDGKIAHAVCYGSTTEAPTSSASPSSTDPATSTSTTSPTPTSSSPTTSSTSPPTSTSSAPTSTTTPAGVQFQEDFVTAGWQNRFDHGWTGEVQAGALSGIAVNDWPADHMGPDESCGDPNVTHRNVHVTPPAGEPGAPAGSVKNVEQAFFNCLTAGDPAKSHLMTSVNTEGYVIAWFSPKKVFSNVHRVCWDESDIDLGGGKWGQVVFLLPSEYQGKTDLGYTSPEFPNNGGPSTPLGTAQNGLRMNRNAAVEAWVNGQFTGGNIPVQFSTDKRPRFKRCVTDNENGTLAVTVARPDGSTTNATIPGAIPNGNIRIVWEDDNYNPDKHFNQAGVAPNSSGLYTWHWDNIEVS